MNKVVSPINKSIIKNVISLQEMKRLREGEERMLTIEISKEPTKILNRSLWIGYRNGGMASWLSCLLPHLPNKQFCVYMDEDSYVNSEYIFGYYSEYFSKLFHKEFKGVCIHPRNTISPKEMTSFNEIEANEIHNTLANNNKHTVLLDLRGQEVAQKDCLTKTLQKYENASYINLPLNDEDLLQTIQNKTKGFSKDTRFITMCAKGYRSTIGYSFLQLIKKQNWEITMCRNPISEIKTELNKSRSAHSLAYI